MHIKELTASAGNENAEHLGGHWIFGVLSRSGVAVNEAPSSGRIQWAVQTEHSITLTSAGGRIGICMDVLLLWRDGGLL